MPTTIRADGRPKRELPVSEPDTSAQRRPSPSPEAVRGGVSIAESVVERIAATAARQVPGIYTGGTGGGSLVRALGARGSAGTDGIRARIRNNRQVNLEMRMRVDYGEHIPTRGEQVRIVVAGAIRELTDLRTREIKVKVTEIIVPDEAPSAEADISED